MTDATTKMDYAKQVTALLAARLAATETLAHHLAPEAILVKINTPEFSAKLGHLPEAVGAAVLQVVQEHGALPLNFVGEAGINILNAALRAQTKSTAPEEIQRTVAIALEKLLEDGKLAFDTPEQLIASMAETLSKHWHGGMSFAVLAKLGDNVVEGAQAALRSGALRFEGSLKRVDPNLTHFSDTSVAEHILGEAFSTAQGQEPIRARR